jgi:flagellin-specific chaperone FliS
VNTYTMQSRQFNRPNPYVNQKIMSASPEQLIVYIYDAAITACRRQDRIKATQAVNLLINSLDFEHKEIAGTFYRTYSALLNLIGKGRFGEVEASINEIRSTWISAMRLG